MALEKLFEHEKPLGLTKLKRLASLMELAKLTTLATLAALTSLAALMGQMANMMLMHSLGLIASLPATISRNRLSLGVWFPAIQWALHLRRGI